MSTATDNINEWYFHLLTDDFDYTCSCGECGDDKRDWMAKYIRCGSEEGKRVVKEEAEVFVLKSLGHESAHVLADNYALRAIVDAILNTIDYSWVWHQLKGYTDDEYDSDEEDESDSESEASEEYDPLNYRYVVNITEVPGGFVASYGGESAQMEVDPDYREEGGHYYTFTTRYGKLSVFFAKGGYFWGSIYLGPGTGGDVIVDVELDESSRHLRIDASG